MITKGKFDYKKAMDDIIEGAIKRDFIAGANTLVLHKGKEIYQSSFGYQDKENKIPMTRDTIFRMFSMSKPVTAVAVMILVERGLLDLWDNLSDYIPEFKNLKVYLPDGSLATTEKEITIWHLLNMTSGIPYPNLETQSGRDMDELFKNIDRELEAGRPTSTLEYCRQIAGVPLSFEPGEKWQYGLSADILGGVIEVVSKKSFGEFLQEEIFEPLGMKDTGFFVPEDKWHRFSRNYKWNEDTKELEPFFARHLGLEGYKENVKFESGGAGLVSTIDDYLKFAQMMLHGGSYEGIRILGRKTVEMMTKDQLKPEQKVDYNWGSVLGYGYGCLMRIMIDNGEAGSNASIGEFGWDGWTGNYVTMDPSEEFILLYFIQRCDAGTTAEVRKLRMAAYAAIK